MRAAITAKSHRKTVETLREHSDTILEGSFTVIDPSSRSMGYCIFQGGEVIANGKLTSDGKIGERLKDLYHQLDIFDHTPLMLMEKVRSGTGHIYLVFSAGVAVAGLSHSELLEIPYSLWSKRKDASYVKSDAMDARYMGLLAVDVCRDLSL